MCMRKQSDLDLSIWAAWGIDGERDCWSARNVCGDALYVSTWSGTWRRL